MKYLLLQYAFLYSVCHTLTCIMGMGKWWGMIKLATQHRFMLFWCHFNPYPSQHKDPLCCWLFWGLDKVAPISQTTLRTRLIIQIALNFVTKDPMICQLRNIVWHRAGDNILSELMGVMFIDFIFVLMTQLYIRELVHFWWTMCGDLCAGVLGRNK